MKFILACRTSYEIARVAGLSERSRGKKPEAYYWRNWVNCDRGVDGARHPVTAEMLDGEVRFTSG